jgi:hypothetical protein
MSSSWPIKFNLHQICTVTKDSGETVRVRVEDVRVNRRGEVLYGVHEIVSGIEYPACETSLKAWKKPVSNRCDVCGETFGFNFACKCGNHL